MTDCNYCEHYKVEHTGTKEKPRLKTYCNRISGTMMMASSHDCSHFKEWKRDYTNAEPSKAKEGK